MDFYKKLSSAIEKKKSMLCIGLDPVQERLPFHMRNDINKAVTFLESIIKYTSEWAAAYKPNFAYFEALGPFGMELLQHTISAIPSDTIIIGDAKRGDVGHSSKMYARAVFEVYKCDAITVNPYQGFDAVQPFLDYTDKGCYFLCLTSNKGASDFQLPQELYLKVAKHVKEWNKNKNCGLVVGATHPGQIQAIRKTAGSMPFLIPGVGAQGGELAKTINFAKDSSSYPFLINASRSIMYASSEEDFDICAGNAAKELRNQIQQYYN